MSDAEILELRRSALTDLAQLPRYIAALARTDQLLGGPGETAILLVRVALVPGRQALRRHPWPKKRGTRPREGTWWAPSACVRSDRPWSSRQAEPGRPYLLPATDAGFVFWSHERAIPFDATG
jgi:hypothetical protein